MAMIIGALNIAYRDKPTPQESETDDPPFPIVSTDILVLGSRPGEDEFHLGEINASISERPLPLALVPAIAQRSIMHILICISSELRPHPAPARR